MLLPEFSLVLHLFVECVSPDVQIYLKWNLGKMVYLQVSSKSVRHNGYS
ncbi:hypothetical protein HMPREF1553_01370 [Porphyromonas gingivalis F0568]|nr:hypothetical protein HMPREF1553_01370 [Porphyromonas gingivalis F0568]